MYVVVIKPPPAPTLVTILPKPIADLSFKLGNISDDILSAMDEDQMRTLLIDARNKISPATPAPSVFVQPSNLFTLPLPLSSPAPTSSTLFTSPLPVSSPSPVLPVPLNWIAFVLLLLPLGL